MIMKTIFIAFVFVFLIIPVQATTFSDANTIPHYAQKSIHDLVDQGVLGGNDDGTFAPARNRFLEDHSLIKVEEW